MNLETARISILWTLLALLTFLGNPLSALPSRAEFIPFHDRPYFMPEHERARIIDLTEREPWARAEIQHLKDLYKTGDGYASAFLYALLQDKAYLPAARDWLLKYGRKGGDLGNRALEVGPDFFRGGQPWLGDVYYKIDIRPLVAYDWVYSGLAREDRRIIERGILASARFRMRAMDRWSQTPNLVLKPTFMVAVAGLATGNRELLTWGFLRKPWSSRGGYLPVLNLMIRDGGPWVEAPIYPIAHKSLLLMSQISRLLHLVDGQDWFSRKSPSGGSPKALMDYFIDTAYPIEQTGHGPGQIRIATYGDGATSASGDLFLVNAAGPGLDLHEELAEAYNVSEDPTYAAFLAMIPDYQPNLIDRRPLVPNVIYPPAPSNVWPAYGIAMLRSDESRAYWTNDKAISVFHIMSQGYGHDHRDKFSITLHGAGRLLYPDYNAVQYENPAVGWTRNSVAHNTVVVDEQDARNVSPTGIRSDFTPAAKFLATSASGTFHGVEQTRALLLTRDYLLDVFHLNSALPHTYDYLLHSFGRASPDYPVRFTPTDALLKRYWRLKGPRAATRDDQWALDFVLDGMVLQQKQEHDITWLKETRGEEKFKKLFQDKFRFGPDWYNHMAGIRVTMAADSETLVAHGVGPQRVAMLVARRTDRRDTTFVATHEPFSENNSPDIIGVFLLARSAEALVVRIDAHGFTDYAAVAIGPQKEGAEHSLASFEDSGTKFAFRSYGYLRIRQDGQAAAWGDWAGFRVPHSIDTLEIDGQQAQAKLDNSYLLFGQIPIEAEPSFVEGPESLLDLQVSPDIVRVFQRDRRRLSVEITNPGEREISGWVDFNPPQGLRIEPETVTFGPLAPGARKDLTVSIVADNPKLGRHTVYYRLHHPFTAESAPTRTAVHGLDVMVGPVLENRYQHPLRAEYRVHAPRFTAAFDMLNGLCRYLADDDGNVRLDGAPLFTFSDGKRELLSESISRAFTWPKESPASIRTRIYHVARYNVDFIGNRMVVEMDPDWTRSEAIQFKVPGSWRSPKGSPGWAAIIAGEIKAPTQVGMNVGMHKAVSAAELAFPESQRSLCFEFLPPQDVNFTTAGMEFAVNSYAGDKWSVGFCPNGQLQDWRWGD